MARKFLVAVDLSKNEFQNAKVHNLAGAPSATPGADKGLMYMNTTDNTLYWWDGSVWQTAKGGTIAFGSVPAETSFGLAKNDGVAVTAARSDHTHGSPAHDNAAHSAIPLSALAAPTTDVSWGGYKITNLALPVSTTDAATKNYVDGVLNGLSWKQAVRAATTANITLSGTQTIDTIAVVVGDRVLVKNQTTNTENGIYVVASGAWTRALDLDAGTEFPNATCYVMDGGAQMDTAWTCTSNPPVTVGTSAIIWAQAAGPGALVAGLGLTQSGTTFNVGAGTGILVAADAVALDTGYTDGRYATLANGAKRYSVDVGGATSQVITHNLATLDVHIQVYRKASPFDVVECDMEHTSTNTATLRFATAPAAAEYRVVVLA